MELQAITLIDNSLANVNIGIAESTRTKSDFSELISNSFNQLNSSIVDSDKAIERLALGTLESTHEVVIAMEKAKMSLTLAIEIRNKLVESYQKILRMQI